MKKLLHVLLALSLLMSISVMEGKEVSAIGAKQVLRIGVDAIPAVLDPAPAVHDTASSVIKGLFEGLVRLDESGQAVPGIAKSWKISNDGKTYTFALRSSAKWSNQQSVTASDFEYAWKRALSPQASNSLAFKMFMIAGAESYHNGKQKDASKVGIKALNDYTLQVTLAEKNYTFLQMLAESIYLPVNAAVAKANKNWASSTKSFVTNGPFKLAAWDTYKIVLVKNSNYYGAKEIQFSEVQFLVPSAGSDSSTAAYINGETDWLGGGGTGPLDYSLLSSPTSSELYEMPTGSTYFYQFNLSQAPFNNLKVRQALAMAIDREALSYGTPAFGFVPLTIHGTMQTYRSELSDQPYFNEDVKTAKKLLQEGLKEAGLARMPEFSIIVNEGNHKFIAAKIINNWEKNLGVTATVEVQDWEQMLNNRINQNYSIARAGWTADYNDPASSLELFASWSSDNDSGWSNKQYDTYLRQARQQPEPRERMHLYAKAERLLISQMAIIPLYYYTSDVLHKPNIQNVYVDYDESIDYTRGYFKP
ncbi:peptide ABC transporter substrate-binding protein [Paenibacillus pedocola]|uniref:peptide ABC transporter substrate-binding protein n=1 Tax=Paenibacillus pedocola TaxID=3242193 RepID=UPI002877AF7F|nr:peptide ABC transporter substrate-binding protein [Paenibacillus typhae]